MVEGDERAELSSFVETERFLVAEIARFDETVDEGLLEDAKTAMVRSIQETYAKYQTLNPRAGKELLRQVSTITDLREADGSDCEQSSGFL